MFTRAGLKRRHSEGERGETTDRVGGVGGGGVSLTLCFLGTRQAGPSSLRLKAVIGQSGDQPNLRVSSPQKSCRAGRVAQLWEKRRTHPEVQQSVTSCLLWRSRLTCNLVSTTFLALPGRTLSLIGHLRIIPNCPVA